MTDDELGRNEKLQMTNGCLSVAVTFLFPSLGFVSVFVIRALSFSYMLAHQWFLVGALVSFLAADQAAVIEID